MRLRRLLVIAFSTVANGRYLFASPFNADGASDISTSSSYKPFPLACCVCARVFSDGSEGVG